MNNSIEPGSGLYSYMKSIGFRLEPTTNSIKRISKDLKPRDIKFSFASFMKEAKSFSEKVKNFIYSKDTSHNKKFISNLFVNKSWLKQYFKHNFYYKRNNTKEFEIKNLSYVAEAFKNWFTSWEDCLSKLEIISKKNNHEKTRRSDTAYIFLKLSSKNLFPLMRDFLKEANHKNKQEAVNQLISSSKEINNLLQNALEYFLPTQTAGLIVTGASTNYYTVNKKPKKYYEDELKETEKKLKDSSSQYKYNFEKGILCIDKQSFELKSFEQEWWKVKGVANQKFKEFSLDEIYTLLKEFKGAMKSKLFEFITEGNEKEIINKFWLFQDESNNSLKEVIKLTKNIDNQEGDTKKNKQENKQERGFYFIKKIKEKKHKNYFCNWIKFCDFYKTIAVDRGCLKAQIKGLEKERLEAERNQYWSLIYRENGLVYLWLVPKDKMQAVRKKLEKKEKGSVSNGTLYRVHSLTMRALHKLCFAEESTFAKEFPLPLKNELETIQKATNNPKKLKKKNPNEKSKDELTLPFLKKLLGSDYAQSRLDLARFDLEKLNTTKDLNEFELELEKACYSLEQIPFSLSRKEELLKKEYNILEFLITSHDLERRNQHCQPVSEPKSHTKLWDDFWKGAESENSDIRLNPDIKIRFRRKDEGLESYLEQRGLDIKKLQFKHRYLKDQYMGNFSLTLNAGKKYSDLAFAKTEEITNKIDEFNKYFNKKNDKYPWRYGIDRGNKELATLCITKFDEGKTYEHKGKAFQKPTFLSQENAPVQAYTLKDKWYNKKELSALEKTFREDRKTRRVIANLSYFVDKTNDEEWFSKDNCSCIDLTTAKVIKGKIILNGDVLTFLKFKKEAAKRLLFDLVNKGFITDCSQFKFEGLIGHVDYKVSGKKADKIYYFDKRFKGLIIKEVPYTKESICENLRDYIRNLLKKKQEHVPSINKVNHLRDALVANMVGVIFHLQKRYPGLVILEDLKKENIEDHFEKLNINISRRLEWALFQKGQTIGWVPPHVKDIVEIRGKRHKEQDEIVENQKNGNEGAIRKEKNFMYQLGGIVFVDEYNTSQACPYCEEYSKDKKQYNKMKFKQGRYCCEDCGFDTYRFKNPEDRVKSIYEVKEVDTDFSFLKEIDDPDKVAAFNISKRAIDISR